MKYIRDPLEIEKNSNKIIDARLDRGKFDEREWIVVKRVVHATADFEYARVMEFSPDAVGKGLSALRRGCRIVTDTRMAEAGINKRLVKDAGCDVRSYGDHLDVAIISREFGITRAMASMMIAAEEGKNGIFAIGNAPTALFKLVELVQDGKVCPDLIIGVPVGLVGAAASKEALSTISIPYLITRGEKGGSVVAVAIINVLLSLLSIRPDVNNTNVLKKG
ncbi:MAG: precorrin-8X methylmutase [Candidatus Atribacteria bacterium]|nr:precorrin-8X methylmutase [Candidatus Atribacteria bacterium]